MKALRCILVAFAIAVVTPLPAEAYSPILTVLKTKKKPKTCVPSAKKKCPLGTGQNRPKSTSDVSGAESS